MRRPLPSLLLLLAWLSLPARADIVVIVHQDSPLPQLSAQDVSDLYLGRLRSTRAGERFLILDQERDSELRSRFFSRLNGMSLRNVNAYWARLQFSGDSQPPVPLADPAVIVDVVRGNRLAVGYVDAPALLPAGVRPVLTLREQ